MTLRRSRPGGVAASLAWIALALPLSAAVAEVVDIDWGTGGRFERVVSVTAGKFVEICGKLAKDTRVRWQFKADQPLDFNVHYHVGGNVVYPVGPEAIAQIAGELVAPADQDYCWMWSNSAAQAVRLSIKLTR